MITLFCLARKNRIKLPGLKEETEFDLELLEVEVELKWRSIYKSPNAIFLNLTQVYGTLREPQSHEPPEKYKNLM